MKDETLRKIRQGFEELARASREIGRMGVFELKRKFPAVLARLERAASSAAKAIATEESMKGGR